MRHLSIDIETYSSVDIEKAGLYPYGQAPDFQILLFAYSWDGLMVRVIDLASGEPMLPEIISALQDPTVIKHAYNAAFEVYCLNRFWHSPIEQWRCTMLHGMYCGYPAGLAAISAALNLPVDRAKLNTGKALIKTFCVPRRGQFWNRALPEHEPEKWRLFKEYNRQDVVAEMEVERRLAAFPVPDSEQRLWQLDMQINACGVSVDQDLIAGALHCDEVITTELMQEAVQLTGLSNPKSVQQLTAWLSAEGEYVENLRKATVAGLIKSTDNATTKRMLEIRQELAKTSIKKYTAMVAAVCADGRVRGLLQFYGSRTGRWAGRLVQVQNLPRNFLKTLSHARDCVKARKVDALRLVYGNIPDTLSQLIRTAFVPSPGNVFLVADFAAIEARVIAWLAGEQWRLDVFATHGKIYEASASAMFGVPIELIQKGNPEYELRQKGKIAELALGYQGAAGALVTMGALTMGLKEEELPEIVHRWRSANKRIVELWFALENAALEVMRSGRPVGIKGLQLALEQDHDTRQEFFTITLPSGRKLFYPQPFLSQNEMGKEAIHFHGTDQNTKKWGSISTYGGKLVENVVQAIARDCLAESLLRIASVGYQTVMHIHDEVVLDVPVDQADLEQVCEIMSRPLAWAPGLPLKADGFITKFYRKE